MRERPARRDDVALALRDLAAHLELPDPPDVAPAVRARIQQSGGGNGTRGRKPAPSRRPVLAGAAIAVSVALIAVVPPARHAVADLLGLRGDRIDYGTPKTPATTAQPGTEDTLLGERVDLEEARRRLPQLLVSSAPALEDPSRIVADPDRPEVSLVYLDATGATRVLLTQFLGDAGPFFQKLAGPATELEPVTVNGGRGVWISGPDHYVAYTDPDGSFIESQGRLSGSALIWEQGDIVLRMEGTFSMEEALAWAATMR